MSDSSANLASQEHLDSGGKQIFPEINLQRTFFSTYASLTALHKEATKKGEAIEYFHSSRGMLESLIHSSSGSGNIRSPNFDSSIPIYHSLLSLIYWLYPNYLGYNRMKNAVAMYRHARTAANMLTFVPASEAFIVGLYIQLRVLPFLVRSKKVPPEELFIVRQIAVGFVEMCNQKKLNSERPELLGVIFDGLGFSYYQFERDNKNALEYLTLAVESLTAAEKKFEEESELAKGGVAMRRSSRAKYSFYQALTAVTYCDLGICYESEAENKEGQEMLSLIRLTRSHYQKAYDYAKKTPWHFYKGLSAYNLSGTYANEGKIQIEKEKAIELLEKAVAIGEESLHWFSLWSTYESDFVGGSWIATFYQTLANESESSERRKLMARSVRLVLKAESVLGRTKSLSWRLVNLGDIYYHNAKYYSQLASEATPKSRGDGGSAASLLLEKSLVNCQKSKTFFRDERHSNRDVQASLLATDICYELLMLKRRAGSSNSEARRRYASMAKRLCNNVINTSMRHGWNEHMAEANWHLAQIFDVEGKFKEAASFYERACDAYILAMSSTPKTRFYQELANYMQAWNRIEKARIAHRSSDFSKASELYREASAFVARSRRWKHSAELYLAESQMEQGELESLSDNAQSSKQLFEQAAQSLTKFASDIDEEGGAQKKSFKELAKDLLTFCNARVILEKSREAYRVGDIKASVGGLERAEAMFGDLSHTSTVFDSVRANELDSLASLCAALQSFQTAQLSSNSKLFLDARRIFDEAALKSKSKTLKPLLIGLANFADFLYSSKKIEESLDSSLDIEYVVKCNRAIENAEQMFKKVGNKSFLSMLRAGKHILDATIKMGAAEREIEDTAVKAKLYAQAQRSLSLALRNYNSIGSSKRVKDSLRMISQVKSHQKLIPLAHDIIAEVASNQIIYTAISSSSIFEQSPESASSSLSGAFAVLDLDIPKSYILQSEDFSFGITISNLGKDSAITVKIDEAIPEGFEIVSCPYTVLEDRTLSLNVRIEPSSSKQIMISARAKNPGEYVWHPSLVYVDSTRNYRITRAETGKVVVETDAKQNYADLLAEKFELEKELRRLEVAKSQEQGQQEEVVEKIYSLKEQISRIEEEFLRTKNEYSSLSENLERVKADITSLENAESVSPTKTDDLAQLRAEEKTLIERIERRRQLLEQACLL